MPAFGISDLTSINREELQDLLALRAQKRKILYSF
jgi:hypothetical protein